MRNRLKGYVENSVNARSDAVEHGEFTATNSDRFLVLEAADTDFPIIQRLISQCNEQVTQKKQLQNCKAYIIKVSAGAQTLYAVRYVGTQWAPKHSGGLVEQGKRFCHFTEAGMLSTLEHETLFTIDPVIDFIAFGNDLFITNDKNFETTLDYRERLKEKRDEVFSSFERFNTFDDMTLLRQAVGENHTLLKKLSEVQKSRHHESSEWMTAMRSVSNDRGWEIDFTREGKIVAKAETDYVKTVLTVLNNGRLESPIDHTVFDVETKVLYSSSASNSSITTAPRVAA